VCDKAAPASAAEVATSGSHNQDQQRRLPQQPLAGQQQQQQQQQGTDNHRLVALAGLCTLHRVAQRDTSSRWVCLQGTQRRGCYPCSA
jgi:hypothetical protein